MAFIAKLLGNNKKKSSGRVQQMDRPNDINSTTTLSRRDHPLPPTPAYSPPPKQRRNDEEVNKLPYYHPNISKPEEALGRFKFGNGHFLLRKESTTGEFIISVTNNEKYEEFVLSTTDYSYFVVKGGKEFKTIGDLVRNYSMSELPCNTASGNGSTGIKLLFPVSNPHLSRKNVFEKNVFDAGEYLNPTEMRAAFERNSTKTIESSEDTAENDGLGERINSSNDTPVIDDSDTLAHKEVRDSNVDPAVGGTGQGSTSSSDDAGQKMVCTNDIYSEVTSYPIHEKELSHGWRVRFEVGREIQFVSPKGEIHSDLPTRITLSLSSEQQDWIKRLFRDSETELTEVNNPVEE